MPDERRRDDRDDTGATQQIRWGEAASANDPDAPTEVIDAPSAEHRPRRSLRRNGIFAARRGGTFAARRNGTFAARRGGLVAAAVLLLLAVVYGVDLALSQGEVPRGVTVAGVAVGGLDRAAAEGRLRDQIAPRLDRPVPLRAGPVETTIDPAAAGLSLDWPATLDQAGDQPLNPWTRLTSLFTTREVGVVTSADREQLTAALEALRPQTDLPPAEGTIRFEGARPIPVDPVPGQNLNIPAAARAVLAGWAGGAPVPLPVTTVPVVTTPEGVRATLTDVVEPAVSAPVTVTGDGAQATLAPEATASALRFAPEPGGALTTTVEQTVVIDALAPQLASTETAGRDAQIVFEPGGPAVVPSVDGRGIDWPKSIEPLLEVLGRTEDRTLAAIYVDEPADFTTAEAEAVDASQVISEFSTGGFAADSGQNIRRIAEQVDGAVVQAGETFSLNGYTSPRNAANGYVEAGIIEDGRPGRGIGGGVSQFATTLYNASYFAGMVDIAHQEHSYYISRYPAGREATVFEGAIDLKFRNDGRAPVLIQTSWTPSSVTVRFLGSKQYDVESISGSRTNFTEPQVQVVQGEPCSETNGSQGFTITDTRVLREPGSGREVDRRTRTVRYEPQPIVRCE